MDTESAISTLEKNINHEPLEWSDEQPLHQSGDLLIGAAIWVPILAMVAPLFLLGYAKMGLIIAGIAVVLHSMLRPRIAVYILIMMVPAEWMVSVIPQVTTITKLLGVLALAVSIQKIIMVTFNRRWNPVVKWVVILLLWTTTSLIWSAFRLIAASYLLTLILVWGMPLLICIQLENRKFLRQGLFLFVVSCLMSSSLFIMSSDVRSTVSSGYVRGEARTLVGEEGVAEVNLLARCFAIGIFISTFFIITDKNLFRRVFFSMVILVLTMGIILTKSRAVYLFTVPAMVCGILLLKGGGLGKRTILAILIGSLVAIIAFAVIKMGFAETGVRERAESIFTEGSRTGGRDYFWREYLKAFISSGGIGKGFLQVRFTYVDKAAHNDLIQIMGDLGVIGLIAFLGIHFCLFRQMMKVNDIWLKMLCIMIWSFIVLAGMVETDFIRKYYGMAIGLIFAMTRLDEAERQVSAECISTGTEQI
jgi:O-antigen ligase